MTLLAKVLQAGKLRPQEGSDLRETLQGQCQAQPPGKVPRTRTHFVCGIPTEGKEPDLCQFYLFFKPSSNH